MRYCPRFLPWFASLALSGLATAAEVVNLLDSGAGSLRDAVLAANVNPGPDTITFNAALAGQMIELSSGALVVTNPNLLTVTAEALADRVTISSFGSSRIFEVEAAAGLELVKLVIADGLAASGSDGSAGGAPTSGNAGGDGGAIHTEGTLTLRDCVLEANSAGNGGAGGDKTGAAVAASGAGGRGGRGGAIYGGASASLLRIEDTILRQNDAGTGGAAGALAAGSGGTIGAAGEGGGGGAIYCEGSVLELIRTVVDSNGAGFGGDGGGNGDGGVGGKGGRGGNGGGLVADGAEFLVVDSTFQSNSAGDGGLGGNASAIMTDTVGAGGDGGDGGGIWVSDIVATTTAHVSGALIRNNSAGLGRNGGNAPNPGAEDGTSGGDGGKGGGLFVASGNGIVWTMQNTTVISNIAGDGRFGGNASGTGAGGAGGDAGSGGGIAFSKVGTDYTAALTHLTIYLNSGGLPGGEGTPGGSGVGADSSGGGIWIVSGGISAGGGLTLANSVVAVNEADSVVNVGSFTPLGNNITTGDPEVGTISNNGGPTLTLPPVFGSPIIDGGATLAVPLTTDQRGASRPINGLPDLGAFEVRFQPDARIGANGNTATHRIDNFYTVSGAGQVRAVSLSGMRRASFFVSAQNDGEIADDLRLSGTHANRTLRLTAYNLTGGTTNITAQLTAGHVFAARPVGDVSLVRFDVRARSQKVRVRQNLSYSLRSSAVTLVDTVLAKVSQKRSR